MSAVRRAFLVNRQQRMALGNSDRSSIQGAGGELSGEQNEAVLLLRVKINLSLYQF